MKRTIETASKVLLTALLVASGMSACDYSIAPLDEGRGNYSIYGYLDLNEPHSYIRVKDLKQPNTQEATLEIDYSVTFENLETGESEVLEDSVVRFPVAYTHNFRTTLDITYDTPYRVTVEGPSGKSAYATTRTPGRLEREVGPTGAPCNRTVRISFFPIENRNALVLDAGFELDGELIWQPVTYDFTSPSGVSVFDFSPEELIADAGYDIPCSRLDSDLIHVRYTHYSTDFFERINTDSLDIPGGAGRFGALEREQFTFTIDTGS